MEWFGVTLYGVQDPIKDMMNPNYVEPTTPQDLVKAYESSDKTKPFASFLAEIDIYVGQADGNAYKSYNRLIRMRNKAHFKPVGPGDMYKYPGCTSMDYGWYMNDKNLKNETWYHTQSKYE